jgi:glycosyltransferase involved in cell wall biosynthesis
VRLIEHGSNLGFAGGSNTGIRASKGEHVALLNNDAVADPGWVEALVSAAETDPAIGMCASRIYVQDRPGVLDSAGLLISRDGIGRGRGRLEPDGADFGRAEDALVPSGCAALYRRAMLDHVGLFDDRLGHALIIEETLDIRILLDRSQVSKEPHDPGVTLLAEVRADNRAGRPLPGVAARLAVRGGPVHIRATPRVEVGHRRITVPNARLVFLRVGEPDWLRDASL